MITYSEVFTVFTPKTPEFYNTVKNAYQQGERGKGSKTVYALRKEQDRLLEELSNLVGTTKVGALRLLIDDWYRMTVDEIAVK